MTYERDSELASADLDRLIELASAYREGRIEDAEVAELDAMLAESPAALDAFVEIGILVAELSHFQENSLACDEAVPKQRLGRPAVTLTTAAVSWIRPASLGALAATLLLAVSLWCWSSLNRDVSFAQLESMSGCLWAESATSTHQGQRIGVGHFRLAEGIAAIRFDNGTKVDLEGPAHVELLAQDRCQLHSGKLVVTVENDFTGFMVETPNGRLIDQGTSFGVSVEEDGVSVVEVFDGRVDVVHRVSGESRSLGEEAAVRLLPKTIIDESEYTPPATHEETNVLQVTTATGRGADCWIWRNPDKGVGPGPLLLARTAQQRFSRLDRRICLRFDLSDIPTADVERATLRVTATPSGSGFASKSFDTTFAAYGVVDNSLDNSLDNWSPEQLSWQQLPGVIDDASQASAVRLLGRFTIPKGQQSGTFVVEGHELTELVRDDSNQLVSIVFVSETEGKKGTLTYAFAGSSHETLRAPTLRLWFEK